MPMEISKTFVVNAPAEAVWGFLEPDPVNASRDACRVRRSRTRSTNRRTRAPITVKVGPVAATYKGTMRFERLDAATRTAEIGSRQDRMSAEKAAPTCG